MKKKFQIDVGGLDFQWELEKGLFLFEGDDAVLFWIQSVMGTLFETIEEISGEDASKLVFEAAGFRQGLVVGEYFQKIKLVSVSEATDLITNTYGSAGWGKFNILDLNMEEHTVSVRFKDSWEYRINHARGIKKAGIFIPSHFAGIFTGLFGRNIWYQIERLQIDGHDTTLVHYGPSDITVTDNIHQLARKKELEEINKLEALVIEKTRELEDLIKEISSPIIPVLEGIVVVPLIGKYKQKRAQDLLEKVINQLPPFAADYCLLDLTMFDRDIADSGVSLLESLGKAVTLLGTEIILVGITPSLSRKMVNLGVTLSDFKCFHTLQHGIHYALGDMGRSIR